MNSLNRVIAVFIKDFKENSIVILIVMVIPLIAFLTPNMLLDKNIKVCIVTSQLDEVTLGFNKKNILYENYNSDALKLLNDKKVNAVINVDEKIVYTFAKDPVTISKLKTAVSNLDAPLYNINVVNAEASTKNYNALLCAILIIMIGLIGNPIVFMSENKDGIISYLMLSPLSYVEFIISKALFSFLCSVLSLYAFIVIIGQFSISFVSLFCLVVVASLFITILSAIISLPFNSVEEMMIVSTPVTLIIVLVEVLSFGSGKIKFLPIQSAFRDAFALHVFPKLQIAVILALTVFLFTVYVYLYRKIKRTEVN